MLSCSNWSKTACPAKLAGIKRGTRAGTSQGFAFNHAELSARRPAIERRTGIASQQPLLIAPTFRPHSDLSIFQKIGVAGPSSTPVSDFRHALGARYCPSGI